MAYIDARYLHKVNINTRERYEVKVWCQLFNCSRKDLVSAVEKVGSNAAQVKIALKRTAHA
jgi:hypothetical protein